MHPHIPVAQKLILTPPLRAQESAPSFNKSSVLALYRIATRQTPSVFFYCRADPLTDYLPIVAPLSLDLHQRIATAQSS